MNIPPTTPLGNSDVSPRKKKVQISFAQSSFSQELEEASNKKVLPLLSCERLSSVGSAVKHWHSHVLFSGRERYGASVCSTSEGMNPVAMVLDL
jgi:hypothetical protein